MKDEFEIICSEILSKKDKKTFMLLCLQTPKH